VPVAVSGLTSGVVAVAAGESHTCALTDAGAVQCWGKNDYGQLGDGSSVDYSLMPVTVTGMSSGVKAIAAGLGHSCAVTSGGTAKCWGSNLYGELGMGTSGSGMHTPTTVAGLTSGATSVAAGANLSCGTTSAGRVLCWGRNDDGQVGNGRSGTQALEETAVAVDGVSSGATAVSAGYGFTCAVISGAAKCWGNNFYLVLGNGEAPGFSSPTPVAVSGLSSGVTAIAASSSDHACALTVAGAIKCWGSAGGALGGGNSDDAPTPIGVVGFP
jgi:alpha-tubulin suppressor-like RCC1 family protein